MVKVLRGTETRRDRRRARLARYDEGKHRQYVTEEKDVGHGFSRAIAGLKACATAGGMQRRSNAAGLSPRAASPQVPCRSPSAARTRDRRRPTRRRDETEDSARRFVLVPSGVSHKWLDTSRAGHVRRTVLIHPIQAISCRSPRNILGADAPVQPGARRKHTGSSRPTSNTAGYSGGRMYADFCN